MSVTSHYLFVKQSDLYPASHFRCALFSASLVLMLVYFLPFHWQDPIWLLYIEVCAFFLGYLLAYNRRFKRFFTFKGEMKEEVHQKALESIREYGLEGKSSYIFLFASQTERCLTCLVSTDLEEYLGSRELQNILKERRKVFKTTSVKEALEGTLAQIRELVPHSFDAKAQEVKTLHQETDLQKPILVEEKTPGLIEDDKTDSPDENQTPAE